MLHHEAVEPGVLALLKELMGLDALKSFSLVGGTALALRHGHRRSIGLDLFTEFPFDKDAVLGALVDAFGEDFSYRGDQQSKWAIFGYVGGTKVDLVHYPHARLDEVVAEEGIRSYSDDDIGPMKVEAILHRAAKKDFWDIDALLQAYGLEHLIDRHRSKYPRNTIAISIPRAITYFVDAENGVDPVSLKGQTWEGVKRSIATVVDNYLR
ncbi:MAG: nucleotidyl transferase AbiEii/AbiGii toxin family protein [Flavobacteriales bacterium]|nr:nucleotidyl transferase AbiEii/AbiGii toxin family protein [Flavobacteriales bacterium]MCB9193967.1 nucleotidyl transferase AbiEii/AbiGii toxin family protein [Flavobacteriales bacterium]